MLFVSNDEVPTGNLVPVRQLVGSNDDILDLAYVPLLEEQRPAGHLLAVVTNSPQVSSRDSVYHLSFRAEYLICMKFPTVFTTPIKILQL